MTDYQEAIQTPRVCLADAELREGAPELDRFGIPKAISGNFAVVFPLTGSHRKWAVRCFCIYHPDQEQRYAAISKYLQRNPMPCTVDFEFLKQGIKIKGQSYPLLKMEWVNGETLSAYVERNLADPRGLWALAERFVRLACHLRRLNIAHGDLQHGNILIVNGEIRLIDYDGMFVPGLEGMPSNELGHSNYQSPRRTRSDFGPHLDNFSTWVIYVSLLGLSIDPSLWDRLGAGEERLLFRREDFEDPSSSEALYALKQSDDETLHRLARQFQSFIQRDLPDIPPLNVSEIPPFPAQRVTPPSEVAMSTEISEPKAPVWIQDHLSPVPLVRIRGPFARQRLLLACFVSVAPLLAFAVAFGLLALTIAALAVAAGLALLLTVFALQFRDLPELQQKQALLLRLQGTEADMNDVRRAIERLKMELQELTLDEGKEVTTSKARQAESAKSEREELEAVDLNLQQALASVNQRRHALVRSQTTELARTLRSLQNQHVSSRLAQYYLSSAAITGIGATMKKRLSSAGVRSAADIANVRVTQTGWGRYWQQVAYIEVPGRGNVHVEGIGPKKAALLLAWRRHIDSQLRSSIPNSLPHAQQSAIESRYERDRVALDQEEVVVREGEEQKKDSVRQKSSQERAALVRRLQCAREQLAKKRRPLERQIGEMRRQIPEKEWAVANTQRELLAFRRVNFVEYLKGILLSGR